MLQNSFNVLKAMLTLAFILEKDAPDLCVGII